MRYLLAGALAPALGSYPYLLFGSGIASHYPMLFWLIAVFSNLFVLGDHRDGLRSGFLWVACPTG
jgi:hypothetical protein